MQGSGKLSFLYPILCQFGAVLLAALLFAASFPNPLVSDGIPLLAWVAFAPVFALVNSAHIGALAFWGALYGYASYSLFNYWLGVFHPLAGLITYFIYAAYFAILFPLLGYARIAFPRKGYLLQWLLWISYEFLSTLGFLGYPYGIAGYTQWKILPIIQIASVFGVWGVSALVVFPSAILGAAVGASLSPRLGDGSPFLSRVAGFFRREFLPLCLWLFALGSALVFGFVSLEDFSQAPTVRISLIQHNTDPWRGGIREYRRDFWVLRRLSLEAAQQQPDLVVWPETAFVPRIYWHTTYRDDPESYQLVQELLDFLSTQEAPYIIGNDDARQSLSDAGIWERVDYNGALLFYRGKLEDQYRKLRLVPFTEHFPYQKQFPWIYRALERADTHFWEKGTEATVFSIGGFRFATPICYEDTFGYLSRSFVLGGAQIIINLTNDAWSNSLPAQMQHASMAVFRAVENRRSLVRAAASGQTCGIDPNGRIIAMAEPFVETWLSLDLPLWDAETPYTRHGDIFAYFILFLALAILLIGMGRIIISIILKGKSQ